MPDVTINSTGAVQIGLTASGVPLGTVLHLRINSELTGVATADSTPLAGTVAASTATASMTVPPGFSRFSLTATWTP